LLAAVRPLIPKEEVSQMEVRHRIEQSPVRAIVLVLALAAALVITLAAVGVRPWMASHPEKSTVPAPTQVVGSGMEPDTRDAYRSLAPTRGADEAPQPNVGGVGKEPDTRDAYATLAP
jgi:hypothetical protein